MNCNTYISSNYKVTILLMVTTIWIRLFLLNFNLIEESIKNYKIQIKLTLKSVPKQT